MNISKSAQKILNDLFLAKDDNGEISETAEEMFRRVAVTVSRADVIYDIRADVEKTGQEFYDMMAAAEFLPNSPLLINAGRDKGQLSSCFVLPVKDDMDSIFDSLRQMAIIHKSGAGTGFNFSQLRGRGSVIKSTGGAAGGPVGFMKVFDSTAEAMKYGNVRPGLSEAVLRIDHPDIQEFINCRSLGDAYSNFSIAVGVTDKFMIAAENSMEYNLTDPATGNTTATLNAADMLRSIAEAASEGGQLGMVFLERINRDNPAPVQGKLEAVCPSGAQPLLPYESCCLGCVNMAEMLGSEDGRYVIDMAKLERTVTNAVHFLDNVIDINSYPTEDISITTKLTRKIGLGIMGWADMLIMLGLPYNSEDAIALAKRIIELIGDIAGDASERLAELRGEFPLFEDSALSQGRKLRNATLTTIAPAGTISKIAGCSAGIEPVKDFARKIKTADGEEFEIHPLLRQELEKRGIYDESLIARIADEGSLQKIEKIPDDIKNIFICAADIPPQDHLKIQAAFQQSTDSGVAKVIEFSGNAVAEDIENAYMQAFKMGCKSIDVRVREAGKSEEEKEGDRHSGIKTPESDTTAASVAQTGSDSDESGDAAASYGFGTGADDINIAKNSKNEKNENAGYDSESISQAGNKNAYDVGSGNSNYSDSVSIGCGDWKIAVNYDREGVSVRVSPKDGKQHS